jgi:glutamate-1-semialdehyde aminotransferase
MNDLERHEAIFPFGAQVSSKSRRRFCRGKPGGPQWIRSGSGAFVFDQDGRSYVDLVAGLGAVTLGHRVDQRTPCAFPLPTLSELRLAEKIQSMVPWAWRMRFLKNGGDATSAAIRLARVYTGRDKIVDFGNYHGCADQFIDAVHDGVPQCVRDLRVRLAPTLENLAQIDDQVAGVILEPLPISPFPDGFLHALRRRCSRMGAVLIFDEVISGFRAHPQGAAGLTGAVPDLTCAGKALGNGWPISVVYGDIDLMSCWERTHLSATHWAEPAAMDAAVANLTTMQQFDFWDRQKKWTWGGQLNNGYWSVLQLNDLENTYVQSKLLDAGIISNLSQFFYLDLGVYQGQVDDAFAAAVGSLHDIKAKGDDVAEKLDCMANQALFRRFA